MTLNTDFDSYRNTSNVISHLDSWMNELKEKLGKDPQNVEVHSMISEIELSIARLRVLSQTEIFNDKVTIQRLEDTTDEYDYRLICEWGYKGRDKWEDVTVNNEKVKVAIGTYIINN